MKKRTRRALLPGITAGAVLAAPAVVQAADPPKNAGPAVVDMDRVLNVYRKTPAFARAQQQFSEKAKVLSEEMNFLSQLRYCNEMERKQAMEIRARGAGASAPDKAKLDGWMKRADEVENEISRLSQKATPTEAESRRIQELSEMRTKAMQSLAEAAAERRELLRELDGKLLEEVQVELLKLVEKVARDQNVPVVYGRGAILFGGNDLTEQVIRRVGK